MARNRHSNNLHGSMTYIHMRDEGSKAICNRTGVHTTKHEKNVTCIFCNDILRKVKKKAA